MVKWTFFIYTLPAILTGLWGGKIKFQDRIIQFTYYLGMIAALLMVPFSIFILGPQRWIPLTLEFLLIGILVKSFSSASLSSKKLINLILLSCISVLICFPWYAHNLINILIGMSKFAFSGTDPELGVVSWNYYLKIMNTQMGYPVLCIFAVTFFFYFLKKDRINWLVVSWAIIPIIVMTFVDNKDSRYTIPTLHAMEIITVSYTHMTLPPKRRV